MGTHDKYPIHHGFLIKSPPENRVTGTFKRWMKRWFVLREDKTLEYYKDRGDPRPKKTIDLNRCECLDTNLSDRRFKNIFSIRVGGERDGRTYYLAAESTYEMKTWIEKICQLCDFKPTENNNNDSRTLVRHQAQLDKKVNNDSREQRDSGILLPSEGGTADPGDTGDHVRVQFVSSKEAEISAYDDVPPPRPVQTTREDDCEEQLYNVPPQRPSQICPLDMSSSSESSSSMMRWSGESERSDIYQNCDNPIDEPDYDVPPTQQHLGRQYEPNYDVPPTSVMNVSPQLNYDVPRNRVSGGSCNEDGGEIYDTPPQHSINNYDTPPRHAMTGSAYSNMDNSLQQSRNNDWSSIPSSNRTPQEIYDYVPPAKPAYDMEPRSDYDIVPPPKPLHDHVPPVNRGGKPQTLKPYVNLQTPIDLGLDTYMKPLPRTPSDPGHQTQRDSGVDDEGGIYDVPPVPLPPGQSAPSVNRSNKPGTAPPEVNRDCKPGKVGEYVNLPMRSATVRESSYQQPRRGGNVQRSKSSVADYESEGYLYMDSPRRTESSLRYSKKEASLPEEDGEYEYMSVKTDAVYQNCDTPSTPPLTTKKEPERTPPLRGLYQDISVVCSRDAPSVPRRAATQYTTIDLQKTKGFRKTCEDAGKGQCI